MPNLLGNAPMVSDKTIMTDYDAGFVSLKCLESGCVGV
jgi:hypothetical protein